MRPRDPEEDGRTATSLELFFDLVFVVAVAQAASGLHHAVAVDHLADGVGGYLMVFFALWWAWVNFTWFASAYDSDDVPYRVTALVQTTGALVLAAGVPSAFTSGDLTLVTAGYVIMRIALVTQWIRAALGHPERRSTAFRYAAGISVVQVGWVALLFVPGSLSLPGFLLLMVAELAVPVWAESAGATPWHPHHIAERYGLLTIIVLGESILATTMALQAALEGGASAASLLPTITGGLLLLYSMWWLYFDRSAHDLLHDFGRAFLWGYGHYFVYASAAAVGAGLAVQVDRVTGHAEIGSTAAGAAVAIPVAVYLATLWLLHHRPRTDSVTPAYLVPAALVLVLLTPFTPEPVIGCGVVLGGLLTTKIVRRHRVAVRAGG